MKKNNTSSNRKLPALVAYGGWRRRTMRSDRLQHQTARLTEMREVQPSPLLSSLSLSHTLSLSLSVSLSLTLCPLGAAVRACKHLTHRAAQHVAAAELWHWGSKHETSSLTGPLPSSLLHASLVGRGVGSRLPSSLSWVSGFWIPPPPFPLPKLCWLTLCYRLPLMMCTIHSVRVTHCTCKRRCVYVSVFCVGGGGDGTDVLREKENKNQNQRLRTVSEGLFEFWSLDLFSEWQRKGSVSRWGWKQERNEWMNEGKKSPWLTDLLEPRSVSRVTTAPNTVRPQMQTWTMMSLWRPLCWWEWKCVFSKVHPHCTVARDCSISLCDIIAHQRKRYLKNSTESKGTRG